MSITIQVELPIVDVEVTDEYAVAVTVTDPLTRQTATVELDQEKTGELIGMLQASKAKAMSAFWEDRGGLPNRPAHGFDTEMPMHPECRAGKCSNCDGVALNGRDEWVSCTHACHSARGAA